GIHTSPELERRDLGPLDPLELEGILAELERIMDRATERERAVKRGGEGHGRVIAKSPPHPDGAVDVFYKNLGLGTRVASVEDHNAKVVVQDPEELPERSLANRLGPAVV